MRKRLGGLLEGGRALQLLGKLLEGGRAGGLFCFCWKARVGGGGMVLKSGEGEIEEGRRISCSATCRVAGEH